MLYIKRDESGALAGISNEPEDGFMPQDDSLTEDEIKRFLEAHQDADAEPISQTDQPFIRVMEDLIEVLIRKNLICLTDLPPEAQSKLLERQKIRAAMHNHLDLLGDYRHEDLI